MPSNQIPDISFVVPTYAEAENLPLLIKHIYDGLKDSDLSWELVVANDDSSDNTEQVCEQLTQQNHPVKLLNRKQNKGLALSVIDGVKVATGKYLVVMDADQSHPSTLVPKMIELLEDNKADFVIGSRNVKDSSTDENWPVIRYIGTFFATSLALPLVSIKDPMAGFFALRRDEWPKTELKPIGYKIALELIVRGNITSERIVELPIHFTDRKVGKSKMGFKELHNYLLHILSLYRFRWPWFRMLMHGGVGVGGIVVDIIFYLGLQALGLSHLYARLISFWPAMTFTWLFNRIYTYNDRPKQPKLSQFIRFSQLTVLTFLINAVVYYSLTTYVEFFANNTLLALIAGILVGFVINFLGSNLTIYKSERPKSSS